MTRAFRIAGLVLFAAGAASCRPYIPDEGPEQPIAFYHSVHAGQNAMPCMYCHQTADRSPSAGLPSVGLCVGCHVPGSAVQPPDQAQLGFPVRGQGPERPDLWYDEAAKLVDYWRRGEAIPWVRIHKVPQHAHFPHYPHVNAGLQCQTCHGPVEEMEKVYQFASLRMGWCIDCHRGDLPLSEQERASVQQRSSYIRKVASLSAAGIDTRGQTAKWPNQIASIDCVVCHY
jgi:hypothetical protein